MLKKELMLIHELLRKFLWAKLFLCQAFEVIVKDTDFFCVNLEVAQSLYKNEHCYQPNIFTDQIPSI